MHCEGMTSVNLGAAAAVFMPSVGPASMSAHALQGPQPWWLQNMTLSKLKVWDRQLYSVVYFQSGWQLWKLCRMVNCMGLSFAPASLAVTSRSILVWYWLSPL